MDILLGLAIGLLLSGISVWIIMRSQIQGVVTQLRTNEEKIEIYLSQRNTQIQENQTKTTKIELLEASLREKELEFRSIVQKVSDANAKMEQLSDMRTKLQSEIQKNNALQSENIAQRENLAQLITNLANKDQKINELDLTLKQINEENHCYQQEIQTANKKNVEANTQKEQIYELKQKLEQEYQSNRELQSETTELKEELARLTTRLAEEQKSTHEKLDLLKNTQQNLTDTFKALSSDALQKNNQQFLESAKAVFENIQITSQHQLETKHQVINDLVKPLHQSLEEFNKQIRVVENTRQEDKGKIGEQLQSLASAYSQLQLETANLTKALRQPVVRGRWGELQLKRVVEISGMQEHCDFIIQETINTDDSSQRPDLIVTLPNQKKVIVDSKAPLKAYLEALEVQDESIQIKCLKDHARHIRTHISQLSSKNYWKQLEHTPEFVIMFLPGEVFFSAALQQDPTLIEFGLEKKVILATPTTLITMLKTIEYVWKQELIAENTREIGNLGRELYDRFTKFTEHLITVRKKLDETVKAYNTTIGSYESRLLVTARKFQEISRYGNDELKSIESIERSVKFLTKEYD